MKTCFAAACAALSVGLSSSLSNAQLAPKKSRPAQTAGQAPAATVATPFANAWHKRWIEPEVRLLGSSIPDDRLAGLRRLATSDRAEAPMRLVELWEQQDALVKEGEGRMVWARGAARFAEVPRVRDALSTLMRAPNPPGNGPQDAARFVYARNLAALALAKAGSREHVALLLSALRDEASRNAAEKSLLRFPPRVWPPIENPTPVTLRFLGDLGDLRTTEWLAGYARNAPSEFKRDAVLAGAKMRDARMIPLARQLLGGGSTLDRIAGTRALVALDAPDRTHLCVALLSEASTVAAGLDCAPLVATTQELIDLLVQHASLGIERTVRIRAIEELGHRNHGLATKTLGVLAMDPSVGPHAVFALARSDSKEASLLLERIVASRNTQTRDLGVAGLIIRSSLGKQTPGREVIQDCAKAEAPSCLFAWVVLGNDPLMVPRERTARLALAAGLSLSFDAPLILRMLAQEKDLDVRTLLLGAYLAQSNAGTPLTRVALENLFARGGMSRVVSARAMARTLAMGEKERARELLHDESEFVRAAAARGLGENDEAQGYALGLVTEALWVEGSPWVRQALRVTAEKIVRALPDAKAAAGELRFLASWDEPFGTEATDHVLPLLIQSDARTEGAIGALYGPAGFLRTIWINATGIGVALKTPNAGTEFLAEP